MKHSTALRFGVVGVVNTLLDFAIFVSLVRGLDMLAIWANVIAFLIAVTNSFVLNRHWTFSAVRGHVLPLLPAYLRFVAVNAVGIILSTIVIYLLLPFMPVELAKLVSVIASLVWNYFGSRHLVFMAKNNE